MATLAPVREVLHVVLVGDFHPASFQPSWFALEGLVGRSEAEAAKINLVHRELASFEMGPFSITVMEDRFQAQVHESQHAEQLRDLVVGTFRIARQAPIKMMGINRDLFFRAPTGRSWEEIANKVAPPGAWAAAVPGGVQLNSLVVRTRRPDALKGAINIKVEPLVDRNQVFFNINDHFEVAGAEAAVDLLEAEFSRSNQRSLELAVSMLEASWART